MEVLEEVRRLPKERTYLKKEDYLRKNLDFKISKTKPITKEPSLVDYLFTVLSIKMINLCTSRQKYRLFPTFLGKYGQFLMIFFLVGPYTDQFISSEVYIVQLFVRGGE